MQLYVYIYIYIHVYTYIYIYIYIYTPVPAGADFSARTVAQTNPVAIPKKICIRNRIVEHSITQITYINILTNIQLMYLITII